MTLRAFPGDVDIFQIVSFQFVIFYLFMTMFEEHHLILNHCCKRTETWFSVSLGLGTGWGGGIVLNEFILMNESLLYRLNIQ